MSNDYDVIVLGGGSPGEHCAGALAEGGLRVAVVERELVGGECSYWACIPSKTLLRPGEAAHASNEAAGHATVDVEAALAWRDFMVSEWSDAGQERWLAENGIQLLRGTGRLAGTGVVEVDGVPFTAGDVVVACGADPIVPPVPGLRELEGVWTSRDVTSMKAVPRSLLVLGGGPVGVEMAQAVRRLGAEVTLVEMSEHVLAREPAALGIALGEVLKRDGIELIVGTQVVGARRDMHDYVLELDGGRQVRGERLLVATGRRPRVDGIGLESVGIEPDGRGIPVDARLCAGERLWAVGDVAGMWPFTHVGKYQARVVASNLLGEPREAHYEAVPRVTYTDPQAAAVGATDAPFSATAFIAEVARTATYTRAYASSNGFLTLLSDGEVLTGAYALGPEAGDWLQQATVAIRARVPVDVMLDVIQPFPTFSEIHLAALKALRQQTHPPQEVRMSAQTGQTPLMLIHGAWLSARSWEQFEAYFSRRGYAVSAPEWPRKHGDVEHLREDADALAGLGLEEIVDHYAGLIEELDEPPVLVGHSFGGLIVERLLARGLGRAGVALSPAPPKGLRVLPFSALKAVSPALAHPSKRRGVVELTLEQFTYGFVNTLSPEAAKAAYERYAVPETGRIFYEAGLANFKRHSPTDVHFDNDDRAPLLIVGAGEDHTVPASVSKTQYERYRHSSAQTDYLEFEGRPHLFTVGEGADEVAAAIDTWIAGVLASSPAPVATVSA